MAGPFGNVVLAVALALFIAWMPGVRTGALDTRIGLVMEGTAAWEAGLRTGDRIESVNGHKVSTWTDMEVEWQLAGGSGEATFGVLRNGARHDLTITFETNNVLGLRTLAGVFPEARCEVKEVIPGSAAAQSGLQVKDVILAVDEKPVMGAYHFSSLIAKRGAKPALLTLKRGAEHMQLSVTPRYEEEAKRYLIGIRWSDGREGTKPWMMYRDPWQQLKWDSLSVVRVLQALSAPKSPGERKAVARNIADGGDCDDVLRHGTRQSDRRARSLAHDLRQLGDLEPVALPGAGRRSYHLRTLRDYYAPQAAPQSGRRAGQHLCRPSDRADVAVGLHRHHA